MKKTTLALAILACLVIVACGVKINESDDRNNPLNIFNNNITDPTFRKVKGTVSSLFNFIFPTAYAQDDNDNCRGDENIGFGEKRVTVYALGFPDTMGLSQEVPLGCEARLTTNNDGPLEFEMEISTKIAVVIFKADLGNNIKRKKIVLFDAENQHTLFEPHIGADDTISAMWFDLNRPIGSSDMDGEEIKNKVVAITNEAHLAGNYFNLIGLFDLEGVTKENILEFEHDRLYNLLRDYPHIYREFLNSGSLSEASLATLRGFVYQMLTNIAANLGIAGPECPDGYVGSGCPVIPPCADGTPGPVCPEMCPDGTAGPDCPEMCPDGTAGPDCPEMCPDGTPGPDCPDDSSDESSSSDMSEDDGGSESSSSDDDEGESESSSSDDDEGESESSSSDDDEGESESSSSDDDEGESESSSSDDDEGESESSSSDEDPVIAD